MKSNDEIANLVECAFRESIMEFLEGVRYQEKADNAESLQKNDNILPIVLYSSLRCGGGGEIALYTVLAAYFRLNLEKINKDKNTKLRLGLDLHIKDYPGKPDFLVHTEGEFNDPIFISEFKVLYEEGEFNSRPSKVSCDIEFVLKKCKDYVLVKQKARACVVVFHHSKTNKPNTEFFKIDKFCSEPKQPIHLWHPLSMNDPGYFNIYFISNDSIKDIDFNAEKIQTG